MLLLVTNKSIIPHSSHTELREDTILRQLDLAPTLEWTPHFHAQWTVTGKLGFDSQLERCLRFATTCTLLRGLTGCGKLPTFRRTLQSPSSGWLRPKKYFALMLDQWKWEVPRLIQHVFPTADIPFTWEMKMYHIKQLPVWRRSEWEWWKSGKKISY